MWCQLPYHEDMLDYLTTAGLFSDEEREIQRSARRFLAEVASPMSREIVSVALQGLQKG